MRIFCWNSRILFQKITDMKLRKVAMKVKTMKTNRLYSRCFAFDSSISSVKSSVRSDIICPNVCMF